VARAVDVGVVAIFRLVLDVGGGDGDAALALFRSLVDGAILEVLGEALLGLTLGDGCGEGSLWWLVGGVEGRGGQEATFPWSTWPMVPASISLYYTYDN
jgi:hypothetical protein